MKNIKVLGTGCANCKTTMQLIEDEAKAQNIEIELEKVEELSEIMGFGVMSTPGVVLNGKVVHSGGIPSKDSITLWLSGSESDGCCSGQNNEATNCCG